MNQESSTSANKDPKLSPKGKLAMRFGAAAAVAAVTTAAIVGGLEANHKQESSSKTAASPAPTHETNAPALTEASFIANVQNAGSTEEQQLEVYGNGTKIYTSPIDNTGHASGVEVVDGTYEVQTPIHVTDPATGIRYSVFKGEGLTTDDPATISTADKYYWIANGESPHQTKLIDGGTPATVYINEQGDPTSAQAEVVATGMFDVDSAGKVIQLP